MNMLTPPLKVESGYKCSTITKLKYLFVNKIPKRLTSISKYKSSFFSKREGLKLSNIPFLIVA